MKLKWVHLKNFRGYKDITVNFDENMNVIIGKNDIGKSTIMEALEIFFNGSNNSQIKIDVDDLNIYSDDDKEIEISCGFSDCFDEIIIDSATKTTLNREYLLNKEGLLEVKKVWNCSKEKITASDLKIYINANYPKITDKPLVNMKISELKKILESIKEQIESYDDIKKSVSSEIRMSIYNYYIHNECEFEETLIDISKEDAKDIWSKINLFLPVFFLFRSDRSNVDSDSEVQNPLKIATKNALKEIEYELNAIKKKVEEAVKVIGDNTINKLKEMNEEIAANLETELNTKAWDSIFSFELIDGKGIPLNKRGSGVRRLMLLSYFRAEAERVMSESCKNDIIYAIEEPETSQHPNYQRMIMETFIDISNDSNHQIILTTHTPEIAKMVNPEQLVFIKRNNKGFSEIVKDEKDKINGIIDSLGILPNITSKLIICVEGETDVMFLENISKLKCFADIIDLDENNISILPMKGGNLKSWIGKNCLDGSNVKEMHLYDSDIQEYVNLIKDMNNKPDGRRWGISTKRLEIENYIPPHLIEERLKIEIEKEIKDNWHKIDVPKLLMSKYSQKRNIEEKQIKCILNGSIAKQITKESLEEINAYEEICEWFRKIKEINNV